jgi:hypothetical protein
MSAAATAAGYLYASGRLRGRSNGRDGDVHESDHQRDNEHHYGRGHDERAPKAKKLRVAVYSPQPETPAAQPAAKKTPKIEYRTRRWRPE